MDKVYITNSLTKLQVQTIVDALDQFSSLIWENDQFDKDDSEQDTKDKLLHNEKCDIARALYSRIKYSANNKTKPALCNEIKRLNDKIQELGRDKYYLLKEIQELKTIKN
eukprot:SAG11_NODE_14558_length_607_cov_85.210630_2_plen_110_part_00